MVESEWFRLCKDREMPPIQSVKKLTQKKYPYFMDEQSFRALDEDVAYYEYQGWSMMPDILFEPTFMILDALQPVFRQLEPSMEYRGLQLYAAEKVDTSPVPLYWVPYLPYTDCLHEATEVVAGKAGRIAVREACVQERRILHAKLPADDLWLISLEAAECLLRRQLVGITMERIEVM